MCQGDAFGEKDHQEGQHGRRKRRKEEEGEKVIKTKPTHIGYAEEPNSKDCKSKLLSRVT